MAMTGGLDGFVRFWDTKTEKEIGEAIHDDNEIWNLLVSPKGDMVLTITEKTVRLWNLSTRKSTNYKVNHLGGVHRKSHSARR